MQGFFELHPERVQSSLDFKGVFTTAVTLLQGSRLRVLSQEIDEAHGFGCSQLLVLPKDMETGQGSGCSQFFLLEQKNLDGAGFLHFVSLSLESLLSFLLFVSVFKVFSSFVGFSHSFDCSRLLLHFDSFCILGFVGVFAVEAADDRLLLQGVLSHDGLQAAAGVNGRHRTLFRDRNKGISSPL